MPARLTWQPVELPFSAGLNQKTDDRARPQPFLDICRDVQFDELGGLQTRLPFGPTSGAIFGGGTLSNCRRLAVVNSELCVFTDTALYSWNAQLSKWVLRGTHLAVAVTETPRFATTGDQIDSDRAELSGTILYVWNEGMVTFVAALDKATGSVLTSPTSLGANTARARLVALATKVLVFVTEPNTLRVRVIDPTDPATGIASAGTVVNAGNVQGPYDVVRAGTQDLCVGAFARTVATSYTAFTVTPAAVVTTSTKARTCDGPIAVSAIPDGTQTQIVRAHANKVEGDLLTTSTFADVFTGQLIGAEAGVAAPPFNQIAAAHRSVQNGGAFRCYVFWSAVESTLVNFASKMNWVDNAGALGTSAVFIDTVGIASRAFDYAGRVFVWVVFAMGTSTFAGQGAAVQNTYFLYRDDGFLLAKTTSDVAGGYCPDSGRLPSVTATGAATYAWCGTSRRRIPLGNDGTGYAARANRDISIAFDSSAARRTAALGGTLYIAAGEILQYDGVRLTEVGFHVYPYRLGPANGGTAGGLSAGTYAYKVTGRYLNSQGEQERSTTATIATVAISGGNTMFCTLMPDSLTVTHKTAVPIALEFWRTTVNPSSGSPFYLVTSKDPAATGTNGYVANDPTNLTLTSFVDGLSDTDASALEANPENENVLEALAPPPAQIAIATATRLFLAGVSGDPDRVWPSRLRNAGEVASFHDSLPVDVPRAGGDITSLAFLEETLFAFRQTAIYALPGQGFDNGGNGQNFGPARIVSSDIGAVNHESVALTPQGLIFKSSKGWYLLSGAGGLEYVGDKVADFDSESVLAVNVVERQHQVRILTSARMLVWDYRANQWGEWTISDGLDSVMYNGQQVYLTSTGTRTQLTSYTGVTYGADVETAWIKPGGLLQGAKRVNKFYVLGEYRGDHSLRIRTAYDYQQDGAGNWVYTDETFWTPSPKLIGSALQVERGLSRGRCQALKIRLTACSPAKDGSPPTTEAIKLTNLAAKVGFSENFHMRLPAAQKV